MYTTRNWFGIRREYLHRPSHDPNDAVPASHLSTYYSRHQPEPNAGSSELPPTTNAAPWPFCNMSTYLLMEWMITGSLQKSVGEVDRLASDVLGHPQFSLPDLSGFSARREGKRLDESENNKTASLFSGDGWRESSVEIAVPLGSQDSRGMSGNFTIPGLHHRSLLAIMKAALVDITARQFHFSPFKRLWKPPKGPEQRCFDEAYTSDAWIQEHEKLQKQENEPGCKLEKVVLGLMFWSDSTHLETFGTVKVWPLYLYFGNLSKYFRGKPSSAASHHVTYIPSVSGAQFCCQVNGFN